MMENQEHIKRVRDYYFKSRFGYRYLLWGSQHFGFYTKNKNISEKEAQALMQDLIAKKLNLSNSHEKNPNPTIAVEWYKLMEKGLWRYNVFTANK